MKRINKNESGRSMVEMLGVLAIIGVLSVGGIYGYRYAMAQFTYHKMLRLIDTLAMSVSVENSKGKDSLFAEGMKNTQSGTKKWCEAYGLEFCEGEIYNVNGFYSLGSEGSSEVYQPQGTNVSFGISSGKTQPYCYCSSDIELYFHGLLATSCEKIVDLIYNKYSDVVIGFSGYNVRDMGKGAEEVKRAICNAPKKERTALIIYFKGYDLEDTSCGECVSACTDWTCP